MNPVATAAASRHEFAPVSETERVQELDVLRGIALFGILIVNIMDYATEPVSGADRAATTLITVLADGTFYPLFSLLFGVGFAVFLERAVSHGKNGLLLYVRRLVALLVIAVLQIILLEDRNILVRYAFLGLPLLLFCRASARVCVIGAFACLALAVGQGPINRALLQRQLRDPAAAAALRNTRAAAQALGQARQAEWSRVAAQESFVATAVFRAHRQVPGQLRWSTNLRRNPSLFHILAMFLLGAALWRSRILLDPSGSQRAMRIVVGAGIIIGLAGNALVNFGPDDGPVTFLADFPTATRAVALLGNTALTLAYLAGVLLLMSAPGGAWRRRVAPLAVIGRLGLTNYLWQSLAMSLLFLPYGLRLEGALPVWSYPLLGVAIFLSHLPFSAWWLKRFRYGPVEWLWRAATYGSIQPIQLPKDAKVAALA